MVGNDITRAGCWAHARRKFVDAEKTHPAIAAEAVGIIRQLYAVEEQAKEQEQRGSLVPAAMRNHNRSCSALREQALGVERSVAAQAPDGRGGQLHAEPVEGIERLHRPTARCRSTTTISEREMKRIVLNRKNSLFVGNERGGQTAAILSSLTSTCRRHDIDPQRYLTQLLTNLPATPISQLSDWLPDQWQRRNPFPTA